MKRIISLVLAVITALCLCMPAFAADNSRFGVTVVSESDTKAVVSIDFNGGTAFNCLDFEVKLSGRVSVTDCSNGAGLRNFKIYVGDLGTQDATVSSFNKDSNPIKFTFATTVGFKAVNGKDLLVITLKKNTADKLTASDVKLTVTNCGISGANATSAIIINTTVTQIGDKTDVAPATVPGQAGTTVAKTTTTAKNGETTVTTTSDSQDVTSRTEVTDSQSETTTAEETSSENKSSSRNKIIIIAALALSMIAVIAAGVIYIARKYKKEDNE